MSTNLLLLHLQSPMNKEFQPINIKNILIHKVTCPLYKLILVSLYIRAFVNESFLCAQCNRCMALAQKTYKPDTNNEGKYESKRLPSLCPHTYPHS